MHDSGKVFGPYILAEGVNLNQFGFKRLLSHTGFPDMKRELGDAEFYNTIWQQDGAKCHTANSVMDYLDRVFGQNMLALKSRQGDTWAPTSPDMSSVISGFGDISKRRCTSPCPPLWPS